MHHCVREMLLASAAREPIKIEIYERFVTSLKQMRLEVQTMKHELEDAIYNLDPLTGAASRIGMLTKLREEQAFVQRKMHSCCLAMMDLDNFKAVNDTYGHAAGDRVLVTVVKHILAHMRPYDMLFRYGGEEFLICSPDTDFRPGTICLTGCDSSWRNWLRIQWQAAVSCHHVGRSHLDRSGCAGRNVD